MNAARRKTLAELKERLEAIHSELTTVAEQEQEAFDAMPEGLQQGERGQKVEEMAGNLSTLADDLENVTSQISDAMEA